MGADPSEAYEALVRSMAADPTPAEEASARRAASLLFGRADALELLREVAREESLLHTLRASVRAEEQGREPPRARMASPRRIPLFPSHAGGGRAQPVWRRASTLAAAAVLVIGIGLASSAAPRVLRWMRGVPAAHPRTVATRPGQLITVDLPDGSRAILAPNTRLRYAISAEAGPRDVELDGEAYFDVKHDDERPFRVRTRRALVEDLGTSFVVREYAGDVRARVAVRAGSAALLPRAGAGSSPSVLERGEGAYVDSAGRVSRFRGDPESYGAWASGRLVFDAARLPEVLSTLSQWYGVEFRLSDSTLANQYFTGGVSSASLAKALAILGPVVHARFERQGKVVVASPRPDGS